MMQAKTNNAIFDILVKDALISIYESELSDLMLDSDEHEYSKSVYKTIRKIGRRIAAKDHAIVFFRISRKAIVSVAAILGIVFGGLLTQPSVYAAVENVIKEIFATNDSYTFSNNCTINEFNKEIRFGYVPDGYELKAAYYNYNNVDLIYKNRYDMEILFSYNSSNSLSISIDNETHNYNEIIRDGITFHYYEAIKDDYNIMMWNDDCYMYCIDAQLPMEEIVRIAENLKK